MIECTCDICGYKGPTTEFLWPRNNEPSFEGEKSIRFDRKSIKDKRYAQGQPVEYLESDDLHDVYMYIRVFIDPSSAETTVCLACFFCALDIFRGKFGPAQPDPCPNPDVHKVPAESELQATGPAVFTDQDGGKEGTPDCPNNHWVFDILTKGWFHDESKGAPETCVCPCSACRYLQGVIRSRG